MEITQIAHQILVYQMFLICPTVIALEVAAWLRRRATGTPTPAVEPDAGAGTWLAVAEMGGSVARNAIQAAPTPANTSGTPVPVRTLTP